MLTLMIHAMKVAIIAKENNKINLLTRVMYFSSMSQPSYPHESPKKAFYC